jgi:hypothetical protein
MSQVDQSPHVADRPRHPEGIDSFLRSPTDPPFTNVACFNNLNNDELFVLASLANKALQERGATTATSSIPSKTPDMFDNAKFEQIACTGLKPRYKGTADALIPFLNSIIFVVRGLVSGNIYPSRRHPSRFNSALF